MLAWVDLHPANQSCQSTPNTLFIVSVAGITWKQCVLLWIGLTGAPPPPPPLCRESHTVQVKTPTVIQSVESTPSVSPPRRLRRSRWKKRCLCIVLSKLNRNLYYLLTRLYQSIIGKKLDLVKRKGAFEHTQSEPILKSCAVTQHLQDLCGLRYILQCLMFLKANMESCD